MPNKTEAKTGGLFAALLLAQRQLQGVEKDAQNSFHRYAYVSAEQMIGAARSALHEAGIVVFRREWKLLADGISVESVIEVRHPDSGESIVCDIVFPCVCEKGRPLDKAVAGCLTTSLSYFLRDLLLVPREDEGAMDRRDDRPEKAQPSVGWRQQPRPEPKPEPKPEATLKELEAATRKTQTERGTLGSLYKKQAGATVFWCISFVSEGGKRRDFVIDEALLADGAAKQAEEANCEVTFFARGSKFPMLTGILLLPKAEPEIPFGEEADDADLPF